VYCKIRADPERLKAEADRIEHRMLLDEEQLMKICTNGRAAENWEKLDYKSGPGTLFAKPDDPFKVNFASTQKREKAFARSHLF